MATFPIRDVEYVNERYCPDRVRVTTDTVPPRTYVVTVVGWSGESDDEPHATVTWTAEIISANPRFARLNDHPVIIATITHRSKGGESSLTISIPMR
jgi:hypothetical protein